MNLARDSVQIFSARVVTGFISFAAVTVFSRELGADPLGVYYPFVALLGVLSLPTDFGLSLAVEKRISEGRDRSRYLGGGALLRLLLLIGFSVPIHLFRDHIATYLGAEVGGILLIALWLRVGADFSLAVLKGELRVGDTAVIRVLQPLIWLAVGYGLLSIGFGVVGIIYSYVLGTLATFAAATWRISIRPAVPAWSHLRSLFDFSKFSFVTSIGGVIYSWMDVLVLTAFVSLEIASTRGDIGAYENAWRVSLLVIFVSRSIGQAIFPTLSLWNEEGRTDEIAAVLEKAVLPGLVIVPPAFVGAVIFSEQILTQLFGSEFAVAAPALIVLVGFRSFQTVGELCGRAVDALDRPDLTMVSTIAGILTNLALNLVLIYLFGILGAAVATAAAFLVKTLLDFHYANRLLSVRLPFRVFGWSLVSSLAMGAVLYRVAAALPVTSLVELVLFVAGGAVIYGLVFLVYTPARESFRELGGPLVTALGFG